MKKNIVLTVAGTDFSFVMTTEDHTAYVNAFMPDNKVAPNYNLLMRTVEKDSKQALKELLDSNSLAAVQMGSILTADFAPQLEITIKK